MFLILLLSFNLHAFEYFQHGGLVTENDPITENMNLFLAEYTSVGGKIDKEYFIKGMEARKSKDGLYLRSPLHKDRSISHDELTAFFILSNHFKTNHRFEIWDQLVKHGGAYPAVVKSWSDYLTFNPANYYVWGMLSGHESVAQIYLPIFAINLLITVNKAYEDTSSKILTWLELSNMSQTNINNRFIIYFDKEMTKMYGYKWLDKLLRIYHNKESENFPIFVELSKIKL